MENFPRLVFDEAHSEAWSLSPDTARRINPVNPADASYALRRPGALPARVRRPRPHRRPARRGRCCVPAGRAGDRAPRRPGRRARHRRRLTPVFAADELDARRGVRPRRRRAGRAGGVRPGQVRQQPARAARPASASRVDQHHRAGAPRTRTRTSRPGCWPTSAPPSARACSPASPTPASTAPASCGSTARRARRSCRHQCHRGPGRPAAGRGAAAGQGRVVVFADSDLFGDDSIED